MSERDDDNVVALNVTFQQIGAEIDAAEPAPPPQESPAAPPEATGQGDNPPPAAQETGLPEDCPVVPLGVSGARYWYLDKLRQLREVPAKDHGRLTILSLVGGDVPWLVRRYPRFNKDGDVVGWRAELLAEDLMGACTRKGVIDAAEKVRGPGAWRGEDGELVLHFGDALLVGEPPRADETPDTVCKPLVGAWQKPGDVGRYYYPAAAPTPRPVAIVPPGGPEGPGQQLLDLFNTWTWRRGEVDALLLLGWIGAAMLGGALDWRPLAWITGGSGTGKSTLHRLINMVLAEAMVTVSDATAAGVWQKIRHKTLPIALDEAEADTDNRTMQKVIKLARQAASGGLVLRGGADHQGSEFMARSCFLFSSILVPPLQGQDRSRMAVLELGALVGSDGAPKRRAPDLDATRLHIIGAGLAARLFAAWPRFLGVLEAYRAALQAAGHDARGGDQFGTLLACAEILLNDPNEAGLIDGDNVVALAAKLNAAEMAEWGDDQRDEERCLHHLLTSMIDPYLNGSRHSVAEWVGKAAGHGNTIQMDRKAANQVLGTYGMKALELDGQKWLAVANAHQGLTELFTGSHWAGSSGTAGVWMQALRRLSGARPAAKALWFSGATAKATLIPAKLAVKPEPVDEDPDGGLYRGS